MKRYNDEISELLKIDQDSDSSRISLAGCSPSQIARTDGSSIVHEMRTSLLGDGFTPGRVPPFLVSFSTHNGSSDRNRNRYHQQNGMLSQWRGYGRDQPVAIVFDRKQLEVLFHKERELFHYWPALTSEVIYDWSHSPLENHFSDLVSTIQKYVHTQTAHFEKDSALLDSFTTLYKHFYSALLILKHSAFDEEQEYRIVVGIPQKSLVDKSAGTQVMDSKPTKSIHYRWGIHGSVPYIRLFEDLAESLPISRVIVGPSRNQRANLERVADLTRSTGIVVHASETPFVEST